MEPCLDGLLVNEGPKIGLCSHECAIESSVDVVVVNKNFVENVSFTRVWPTDVSGDGGCEQRGGGGGEGG